MSMDRLASIGVSEAGLFFVDMELSIETDDKTFESTNTCYSEDPGVAIVRTFDSLALSKILLVSNKNGQKFRWNGVCFALVSEGDAS